MKKNIFKNAEFGDMFETNNGRKCIYVFDNSKFHTVIHEKCIILRCNDDGTILDSLVTCSSIIGRWKEPNSLTVPAWITIDNNEYQTVRVHTEKPQKHCGYWVSENFPVFGKNLRTTINHFKCLWGDRPHELELTIKKKE